MAVIVHLSGTFQRMNMFLILWMYISKCVKCKSNLSRFTYSLLMFSQTFDWAPQSSDSGSHICFEGENSVDNSFAAAKNSVSKSFLGNRTAAAARRCSALRRLAAAAAGSQMGRVGRAGWSAGPTVLDLQYQTLWNSWVIGQLIIQSTHLKCSATFHNLPFWWSSLISEY